jgi:hypothetical protein
MYTRRPRAAADRRDGGFDEGELGLDGARRRGLVGTGFLRAAHLGPGI